GLPGQNNNPAPIIIVASPTPQGTPTPGAARPTAGGVAQPTASGGAAQPTPATGGPAPTVAAGSASKGTITFAFDAFPTYYPGIIMDVDQLLQKRGYELKLVPFALDNQPDVPEEQRWAKLKSGEYDVLATTLD